MDKKIKGDWFPDDPTLRGIPESEYSVLRVPYHFRVPIGNHSYEVGILPGFVTDGASIPRFFWRVVGYPLQPDLIGPAMCHDAMYAAELFFAHPVCDAIFYELLKINFARILAAKKCGRIRRGFLAIYYRWRALSIWLAVRVCGGFVWRRHTLASVEAARKLITASMCKKGKDGKMKKTLLYCIGIFASALQMIVMTGCVSKFEAIKMPETAVPIPRTETAADGKTTVTTNDYKIISGGYSIYARSPLWSAEAIQGLKADIGEGANHVSFSLDKYNKDLSTNAVAMVAGIESAVCDVVGKVAAAYVTAQTGGASAAVSSLGSLTLSQLYNGASTLLTKTNTVGAVNAILCEGTNCTECVDGNCTPTSN